MRAQLHSLPTIISALVGLGIGLAAGSAFSQDTTRALADTSNIGSQQIEEQVLTAISIIAVVEKPSVAILPRRIKPEFERVLFFDRSFNRELKEIPVKLLTLSEELESAKKIEKLKKLLVKNKK